MEPYVAPLDEIRFTLDRVVGLDHLLSASRFEGLDADTVHGAIAEAARFITEVFGPLNTIGDRQGTRLVDGKVVTPDGWAEAYRKFVDAGWGALPFDTEFGGGGFPDLIGIVLQEMMVACNMSFSLCPLLTQGAIHALEEVADAELTEQYLSKLVTGEWTGTMNLTEPEAGSDVGALRTKAVPNGDGSWRITGNKIFITYGEHEMTDNIVHLVLARTPDAPPGTKGISCFLVPKYLVNADGSLGDHNDLSCVSLEHKMGIHASPTCVMSYGDGGGATGWLLGNELDGMRVMFVMMNMARLSVGVQGLGIAERATQATVRYANERTQGQVPGGERGRSVAIVEHPDVRRMLWTMRAYTEAMRGLLYEAVAAYDLARHADDAEARAAAQELVDLLTPVAKSWSTDLGVEVASLAVQVYGGMGYVEETGVAQLLRDSRIAPIYEGTNGIQAMDLVGRKVPMRGGGAMTDFIARMRELDKELDAAGDELATIRAGLSGAIDDLDSATRWIFSNAGKPLEVLAGASPYLRLMGVTVGGWMLARGALAAREWKSEGGDASFCDTKLHTARFYAEQLLPQTKGLVPQITAGGASVLAGDLSAVLV
jgi:alkylation response protein AidB-like acyl-CoA dehydrogenase